MNHPFLSYRREISDFADAISFLSAVVSINGASTEDIAHIMNREDVFVKDETVKRYLSKHGAYVGCLLDNIENIAVKHGICESGTLTSMNPQWHARLRGASPFDASQLDTLNELAHAFDMKKKELGMFEGFDCGSSSPSDYSDSETHTTDNDEDEDDEEDEDEEDDEDEDEDEDEDDEDEESD
jgi:hypothetical protein